MDYTNEDREYDREIVQLNRLARVRGDSFVQFATSMAAVDETIEEGREELGHPSSWLPDDQELDLVIQEAGLCRKGLHRMVRKNVGKDRGCVACRNIRRRRKVAEKRGEPLCWTSTHPEPDAGFLCPCGEEPPDPWVVDWATVEGAIDGRSLFRSLTPAEELCCLVTVSNRWGGGLYDAAGWLWENSDVELSTRRVEYLVEESRLDPVSADEVFYVDLMDSA